MRAGNSVTLLFLLHSGIALAAPPVLAPIVRIDTTRDAGSSIVDLPFPAGVGDLVLATSELERETRTDGTGAELAFNVPFSPTCVPVPLLPPEYSRFYLLLRTPAPSVTARFVPMLGDARDLELRCESRGGEQQCLAIIDPVEDCSAFRVEGVARSPGNTGALSVRHTLAWEYGPSFFGSRAGFELASRGPTAGDPQRRTLQATWAQPEMRAGETRIGFLDIPSTPVPTIVPFEVVAATPLAREALVLAPINSASITIDGNETRDRIAIDVPAGATRITLRLIVFGGFHPFTIWFAPAPVAATSDTAIPPAPPAANAPYTTTFTETPFGSNQLSVPMPTPGRWYLTFSNPDPRPLSVNLSPYYATTTSPPDIADGAYANLLRPGHGVFISRGGDGDRVLLWFTYDADGQPIWYLGQTPVFGQPAAWSVPLRRYGGGIASFASMGYAVVSDAGDGSLAFSWFIDGRAGSERMQPLANCRAGTGRSGTWTVPSRDGVGLSVVDTGDTEVSVLYTYDAAGNPRWLYAQNAPGAATLALQQYRGFCPSCAYAPVVPRNVGTLSRTYRDDGGGTIAAAATLAAPLLGTEAIAASVQRLTRVLDCRR